MPDSAKGACDYTRSPTDFGLRNPISGIRLFWLLASIQFVWTFMPLVMKQADFGEIVGELLRFVLVMGFFLAVMQYAEPPAKVFRAMKMSSAWLDRNTKWGLRRFIRSLGIVQSASVKLISLHVALVSSLLRTIVSNSSLAAARMEGVVPMRSMYWYIKPISSGVSAQSRGSNLAMVVGRTKSAGFSTF